MYKNSLGNRIKIGREMMPQAHTSKAKIVERKLRADLRLALLLCCLSEVKDVIDNLEC